MGQRPVPQSPPLSPSLAVDTGVCSPLREAQGQVSAFLGQHLGERQPKRAVGGRTCARRAHGWAEVVGKWLSRSIFKAELTPGPGGTINSCSQAPLNGPRAPPPPRVRRLPPLPPRSPGLVFMKPPVLQERGGRMRIVKSTLRQLRRSSGAVPIPVLPLTTGVHRL